MRRRSGNSWPRRRRESPRKEKILRAALDYLSSEDFDSLTVRGIAARAGTNSALIGYYFGSKEGLVEEALGLLFDELRASFSALDDESLPPLDRLKDLIVHYARVIASRPDLFRRIFAWNGRFAPGRFVDFIAGTGLPRMLELLSRITGVTDRNALVVMIRHTLGAVVFPILAPEPMERTLRVSGEPDLESDIGAFMDNYFHRYLPQAKGPDHD